MNVKVKNCSNCPMRRGHSGHGESWDYCSHPKSPRGYGHIIDVAHPEWCPLKKESYTVSIDGEVEIKENTCSVKTIRKN